jgi:4-hydroxybenzoate polyprenyltransferase
MASVVYVLNDIMDIEADRADPIKCQRLLPSGAISLRFAYGLVAGLFVIALLGAGAVSLLVLLFVGGHFAINIPYSWRLKHVVTLDVF